MTDQDSTLRAAIRPWAARAASLVERRIADARMHAAAGSAAVATFRLDELHSSIVGHISDARGAFYRDAFRQHRPLDPAVHLVDMRGSPHGEAAARSARILGRSYDLDIRDLIEDAKAGLQTAMMADGGHWLANWATDHAERIAARAVGELSDSQIAIFEAVGQVLVRPELR